MTQSMQKKTQSDKPSVKSDFMKKMLNKVVHAIKGAIAVVVD